MEGKKKIIWGSGSGPCWRAMIVLEEKGFSDCEKKCIQFSKKEHKGEDVMKINPRGQVPTFQDGEYVVNESLAVCFYLESVYKKKGTQLIPDDQAGLAQVLQRTFEAQENFQSKVFTNFFYIMMGPFKDHLKGDLLLDKKKAISDELSTWEGYMEKEGESYICGKHFTMADVVFFSHLANIVRFGCDLKKYSKLLNYYERLKERESVKNTWPPHWNEEPNKDYFNDL